MADKPLLLHTIDACTQTAGRDPRLSRSAPYNKAEALIYLIVATCGVIACIVALVGFGS